jgi:hypothetical protein
MKTAPPALRARGTRASVFSLTIKSLVTCATRFPVSVTIRTALLTELRFELTPLLRHDSQLPSRSRSLRYEGMFDFELSAGVQVGLHQGLKLQR